MSNIQKISFNGIGIALFVTLSLCLQVPIFENYYLCLGYVVMSVYLYSFGIISGTLVGTLGTILYCFLINGLRGMPGWSLGNIFIGIILGLVFKYTKKINKKWLSIIINILAIVIVTAVGILGVKSLVEVFLYSQPFLIRVASNIYAFVADIIVLIISLPICGKLNPIIKKIIKN
jgi:uncharacterized membrane protein